MFKRAFQKDYAKRAYNDQGDRLAHTPLPEGMIEAWISKNRIDEMERQGWYRTPHTTPGAVLMRGREPEPLRQGYIPQYRDEDGNRLYDDVAEIDYDKLNAPEKEKIISWSPIIKTQEISSLCESPIERDIVGGLLLSHYKRRAQVRFVTNRKVVEDLKYMKDGRIFDGFWLHVFPQIGIGEYRVDFLIVATGPNEYRHPEGINHHQFFIVECDGGGFHRDKEKDRLRDRYFISRGFEIIRFTGTEIWRNAAACGEHIVQTAIKKLWPTELEMWRHTTEAEPFMPFSQLLLNTITAAEWRYYSDWEKRNRESNIADSLGVKYELYGTLIDTINVVLDAKFNSFNPYMKARVYNGSGFNDTIFTTGLEPEVMVDFTAKELPFKERKPRVVVKLVRPDKEANKKTLDFYKSIRSVAVIIFVDVTTMRCGVWQRTKDDWTRAVLERDGIIKLKQYETSIPVNDFYQNTPLIED